MRSLLLFMLAAFIGLPAFAQLSCSSVSASMSLSTSGGTVTLTNNSTPTATSSIYTNYQVTWGDNSSTYAINNNSLTHTYNTTGTYTVTLYSQVYDSLHNITCRDTATSSVSVTTSLNCSNVDAKMTAYMSGTNIGVVMNHSTPVATNKLGVSYKINWGDGNFTNTSSVGNQTHVYSSSGTYTVQLFVTVHDSNNNITCVDSTSSNLTVSGSGTLNCNNVHAGFATSVNAKNVILINNSTPTSSGNISASYNIYWGDGSTSLGVNHNNKTHVYSSYGTYTISLVAIVTQGSLTCTDSTSDTVNITLPPPPPNKIEGTIYVDSTSQLDSYKVWLIKFDSSTNILSAVDSIDVGVIAGAGYYHFGNKPSGNYRTKAARLNGPSSGTGYVPTYHDSALLWSNASVIAHTGGSSVGKDIYMKKGTITSGPGFIGGNVNQGANKGTASGVAGMNILLMDASDNIITYTVTDANGAFKFQSLPNATYKVYPENMNYKTTPAVFTLTAASEIRSVTFERSLSQKTIVPKATGITEVNSKVLDYNIYPNPAGNTVNINWGTYSNDMATVTITDISGKKVFTTNTSMNSNTSINISQLQSGLYFMTANSEYGNNTKKLIVQ